MGVQTPDELDLEKQLVDYKSHSELQRANLQAAFSFVGEGIKAAFLLNGAAGIALMTFVAAQRPTGGHSGFTLPLICFAIGAALAVVTLCFAYISQGYFAKMNVERRQRCPTAEGWRNAGLVTFGGSVVGFSGGLCLAAIQL